MRLKGIDYSSYEAFTKWLTGEKAYLVSPKPLSVDQIGRFYKNTPLGRKWFVAYKGNTPDQVLVRDVDFNLYVEFLRWQSQVT